MKLTISYYKKLPNLIRITISTFFFTALSVQLVAQESIGTVSGQQQNQQLSQEKQSSGATSRIDESQLVGLPMNGRSYNQLATLEAGISDTSSASSSRGLSSGGLNVSGGQGTSNVYLLDGTNIMGMGNQGPRSAAGTQLSSDSVLQVLVFGTNYSAEYGRGSGGILNSITRSGTPEFHGTLFEYLRNSKLDARNFFDGTEPPPFKRNQFGFTITGPIVKQKTFFMFGFEALRDRLSETEINEFPDLNAHAGRITDCEGRVTLDLNQDETAIRLYGGGIHPNVRNYLALYPLPNGQCLGGGVAEDKQTRFLPSDDEFFVLRIDHQFSLQDSMFVRYNFDDARSVGGSLFLFPSRDDSRQQFLTAVETHIFSPSAINSFRFGYTRPTDQGRNTPLIVIPREMFFIPDSPDFGQIGIPRVSQFGSMGGPSGTTFNSYQFSDDMVLQRGTHTIKFGTEIHRYNTDTFTNSNRGGVWAFNSLESFLRGGPEGTNLTGVLPGSSNAVRWRQTLLGFYINDSYAIRSNLRFDLGVRYEFSTLIHDLNKKSVLVADPLHDTVATLGPFLDHNPSLRNISPRLGISWSPGTSGNTTVRTGFGIYYDHLLPYALSAHKATAPFYKKTTRTNFNASGFDKDGNPLPYAFPDAVAVLQGMPLQAQVFDYHNFTTPMVLRYGLEVQQELPGGWGGRFSYVGSRANHLSRRYEWNLYPFPDVQPDGTLFFPPQCDQIPATPANATSSERAQLERDRAVCRTYAGPMNPAFAGGLYYLSSDGQSFYNSLRVTANKRLPSGTSFQASYTLAKSVDDADEFGAQYPHSRSIDRARSGFDSRQQLSFNYFYTLPFGSGQRWLNSGVISGLFGGWRIGGIVRYRTGTPFSPGINVRRTGYLFETKRPNLLPGESNRPATEGVTAGCGELRNDGTTTIKAGEELGTPRRYFDPCIYAFPEFGTLGNAGRNTITGPNVFGTDISLQREFVLGGDRRLQFRMEVFNPLNHTTFRSPGGSAIFSGAPGRINPSVGRITGTSTTSRQVQFALRLSF
ncbi:MAG: TonB-dependent receptor [Acidobacteria bacterium]|nr:TonB-dependent receptor [Acidobacteriota bacterium]